MTMNTPGEQFQSQESFALPEQLWDAFQGSIHSQDGRFANETWEIKKLKPQPKEESSLLDTINGAIRWLKLAKSVVPMMQTEENATATTNNLSREDDNAEDDNTTAATASQVEDHREFIGINATHQPYSDDSTEGTSETIQTIEEYLRRYQNRRPSDSDSMKRARSLLSIVGHKLQDISESVQSDIIGGVNVGDLEDDGLVLEMSIDNLPENAVDDDEDE
jgi:hypothetical protein